MRDVGKFHRLVFIGLISICCHASWASSSRGEEVTLNILAVNGTDEPKEKEIKHYLPAGLTLNDILDTSKLKVDYDVNEGAYYVHGNVTLGPKETVEYKVKVNDVWNIDPQEIDDTKKKIEDGFEIVKGTEYHQTGEIKKNTLNKRLDDIVARQKKFEDDVDKRIDRFHLYKDEIEKINSDALSVSYWRSKPPPVEETGTIKYVIEIENPSKDQSRTVEPKHYLPEEVKPEHIIEDQGFDMRFDAQKGQHYMTKEVTLKPAEVQRFEIEILDIWKIQQDEIDNLRDRTKRANDLLKDTQYAQSAAYLVESITNNLNQIEQSQSQEKNINEHISAYRVNKKRYDNARDDVEALEALLMVVKEEQERSILKNVLQKIRSLKSVADVAESIFSTKPAVSTAWRIITGIVIFVSIITFIHFFVWGKRSKAAKLVEKQKQEENKEEQNKA